jgi:hypothetical protein
MWPENDDLAPAWHNPCNCENCLPHVRKTASEAASFYEHWYKGANMDLRTLTYTASVLNTYGRNIDLLKPPEDTEFTGEFRPAGNEEYLSTRGQIMSGPSLAPRLILKRKKRTRVILEDTGRIAIPAMNEWCKYMGVFMQVTDKNASIGPCNIYTYREEEY